jgi:hypothetical protein
MPGPEDPPTKPQFRDTTPANTDVRDAVAAALEARRQAAARSNDTASAAAIPAEPRFAWAVGAQAFCLGTAAIYTAPAIEGPYSFSGSLCNQLTFEPQASMLWCAGRGRTELLPPLVPALPLCWEANQHSPNPVPRHPQLNGQCEAPGNVSRAAVGGPCNQFGSRCRMWEVVDFAQGGCLLSFLAVC